MTKVFVYYNLHKKCWSVRDYKTRRVIDHTHEIILHNCTFKVSQSGRNRVLKEQRKNVHAGIVGYVGNDVGDIANNTNWSKEVRITYNPYKYDSFVKLPEESAVSKAEYCMLVNKSVKAFV
jgi:hypothetical protein